MKYSLLASGSKGNCFVLESSTTTIVIDCGTTRRYLQQGFSEIGLGLDAVDALLITHDHSDHISQIKLFAKTSIYAPKSIIETQTTVIPYQPFYIKDFKITAIPTSHDSEISVGYIIETHQEKLVYMTDTGYIRDRDIAMMDGADYYIIESNHDPALLMQTKRPYIIKRRILSDSGHLSNQDAGQFLAKVVSAKTKEIVLAHLSEEANSHELAHATIQSFVSGFNVLIRVGKQYEIVYGGIR